MYLWFVFISEQTVTFALYDINLLVLKVKCLQRFSNWVF